MREFKSLQESLEEQKNALITTVEKVNRAISHHQARDQKNTRQGRGGLSGAPKAASNITKSNKAARQVATSKRFEEDKAASSKEEEKRSFRSAAEMNAPEPHSQQARSAANPNDSVLPPAAQPMSRTHASGFNEEIINTSKEIHGEESQKSRAELQSHRSGGGPGGMDPAEAEANPNFRST